VPLLFQCFPHKPLPASLVRPRCETRSWCPTRTPRTVRVQPALARARGARGSGLAAGMELVSSLLPILSTSSQLNTKWQVASGWSMLPEVLD
jgi:hypothetical protein